MEPIIVRFVKEMDEIEVARDWKRKKEWTKKDWRWWRLDFSWSWYRKLSVRCFLDINYSSIILGLFYILMKANHLIMKFLDSYLFIEINPSSTALNFVFCCLSLMSLIIKINITLFNELLPKFTHTLSILGFWTVSDNAGSSPWFQYLLLRGNLRLRIYLWSVKITSSSLIIVRKNPALSLS